MSTPHSLLQQMGKIREMERGKLCPMRGGRYFNHQTWEQGRNVVRYVPAAEAPALQKSITAYRRFMKLTEQYIALVVQQTRHRRADQKSPSPAPGRGRKLLQPQDRHKKEE
jgi:hypothetical protein